MGHLPKWATFDLVTQICVGLMTACIPGAWALCGTSEPFSGFGLAVTIISTASAVLSVTSPFWMQLHPRVVLFLIYSIALGSPVTGALLMHTEVKHGHFLYIIGHICQVGLGSIIGRNVDKSPERTAPFDAFRRVHMLIGGALVVIGSIMAIFKLRDSDYSKPGIIIVSAFSCVAFGAMLAFPLWHRHGNPLVRVGVASVTSLFVGLIPLLGFAKVAMFYPVTMPGQILACYALGGYLGEAQRQMMIDKAHSQDDQQHDDPEQPAEQPLAASAEPIEGIDGNPPGQILACYALGGYQGEAQRQMMIDKARSQDDQQHDDPEQPAEQPVAASAEPIEGIDAPSS